MRFDHRRNCYSVSGWRLGYHSDFGRACESIVISLGSFDWVQTLLLSRKIYKFKWKKIKYLELIISENKVKMNLVKIFRVYE